MSVAAITPLARPPEATVRVPGSKSHTNRALICAALADGRSILDGVLLADDTMAMMESLRSLGIGVDVDGATSRGVIEGVGRTLPAGPIDLDARQSGTTSRFLLPLLALGPGPYRLDGDPQLRARPIGELSAALRALGAGVDRDQLPITVTAGGLAGGRLVISGDVSSQFLSGLLLSAPWADAPVEIEIAGELVSRPYIDLTVATMAEFGARVTEDAGILRVEPGGYVPADVVIEPDASAASYFFAAAAITGGRVRINGLGRSTVQGDLRFVDVLEAMGATVERGDDYTEVLGGPLRGVDVDLADLSDTAQTLAVVAPFAATPTTVTGIGFIRKKETDRIGAVVRELSRLGIRAVERDDGFVVHPGRPAPGVVETYDDHRMAMSFALLGLVEPGILIDDPGCVSKTYPDYFAALHQLA